MEDQKILGIEGKVVIIADYREKEVSEKLKSFNDVVIRKMSLEVGDFVCSERTVIERKTHSDFVGSIIDGRIFEQTKMMKENFENPIIIVEGYSNREINDNALKATLASLLVDYEISVVNSKNPMDTARIIYWIAEKEQHEHKCSLSFKVGKKPEDEEGKKEFIVSSLPGVSNVLARRLLEHFGSVEKVFTANEEELKDVKGIGKKLSGRIKKILEMEYKNWK